MVVIVLPVRGSSKISARRRLALLDQGRERAELLGGVRDVLDRAAGDQHDAVTGLGELAVDSDAHSGTPVTRESFACQATCASRV
jgi:hypothetical protein